MIVLSPAVRIPVELEKQFVVLEPDLPDRDQLEAIGRPIASSRMRSPRATSGIACWTPRPASPLHEAEGAFSLSLVRRGRLAEEPLWEIKGGMLKKSGLNRSGGTFADLGGLEALKSF